MGITVSCPLKPRFITPGPLRCAAFCHQLESGGFRVWIWQCGRPAGIPLPWPSSRALDQGLSGTLSPQPHALGAVRLLLLEAHIQLSPEPVLFLVGSRDHDTASKDRGAILTWRAHVLILTLEDSLA